jgi:hypothetical protein
MRGAPPLVLPQDNSMEPIKLIALDDEDLKVFSTHLQDAIIRMEDMAFLPKERRFAAILSRFDWFGADHMSAENGGGYERHRAALRFERVLSAKSQNIDLQNKRDTLELLALSFEAAELPEGHVTLFFAGGGAVRLHVECIEAELRDLGPTWKTRMKPGHSEGGAKAEGAS